MARSGLALVAALVLAGLSPVAGAATGDEEWAVCDRIVSAHPNPPEGAVVVAPVDNAVRRATAEHQGGTTFWLAPGTHTLGEHEFGQVIPKDGNVYLGAPGAILDGRERNRYAFTGDAHDVVLLGLTVRNFVAPRDEGVVNHDSGDAWVIEHNTIENNGGAALMAGTGQVVRGNCLRDNGQYGINAYKRGGLADLLVEGNEITGNNTENWEAQTPGCGCTGGVKFWAVDGADIRDNWVHDNRGAGLWADTNNNDFLIEHNLIENNDGEALLYETSYNAVIRDNVFLGNTIVQGRTFADRGDDFPVGTVYVSESGGEPRVPARTDRIEIHDNTFEHNWSGITLWENADRFCNSPANTSTGHCTLLVAEVETCTQPAIAQQPLRDDCRWKTQRVDIHHNRFLFDPATLGCDKLCGRMAILSNWGTYPWWSPYMGPVVQQAITFEQHNTWRDNVYVGPWTFTPFDRPRALPPAEWQGAPYGQDVCSAFTLLPTTC
ncbi:MAG: right-handed parallel beta-helix repeat-containing protein [Actinophytocola sp.]|uniref:right-handed parallel beta-helix repeat-containing protein n=1 Tax=Actinophytocola sp. TaxID=1872138 RepID=UPI003C71603B